MKYINEAAWDRIVRVILGLVMLVLGWAGVVTGGWGEVLKYLGFLPLLTGIVGFCPLYWVLKFRTKRA
jgi:hypothetical protein